MSGHPFISPGDVQIQLSDSTVVQNGGTYVKNANNQLVLQGVYATGAMIKSAVLQSNSFTNKEGKEISTLEMTIFDLDKYEEEEPQTQDLKQNRFKRK